MHALRFGFLQEYDIGKHLVGRVFVKCAHARLGWSAVLGANKVPEFGVVMQDFQVGVIYGPSGVGVA